MERAARSVRSLRKRASCQVHGTGSSECGGWLHQREYPFNSSRMRCGSSGVERLCLTIGFRRRTRAHRLPCSFRRLTRRSCARLSRSVGNLRESTMTADEFASSCAQEKSDLLAMYLNPRTTTAVGTAVASLKLDNEQSEIMKTILDAVLTDAFYTMLLALNGEASLGGRQENYLLTDSDGNTITGELDAAAWQHFYGVQP